MYVPIMKNLEQEKKVIRDFSQYFSDDIIPLFEIITDYYEDRFEIDPETGKPLMIKPKGKKRRKKVKLPTTEEDRITLPQINELLNGKRAFIDFFRYTDNEYKGDKIKTENVQLSFAISRNYNLYRNRMLEIKNFENFIPTISIKEGFKFSQTDLTSLCSDLKSDNNSIAIRITDDLFEEYSYLISSCLSDSDYILLDIREQNVESRIMELYEFEELDTSASKLLLNSPRIKKTNNGEHSNLNFTDKIDNSCAVTYQEHNLDGFGDFGGLKDKLPSEGGPFGCALALVYLRENNQFFSVVNKDSKLGLRGFRTVVPDLLKNKGVVDPNNNCPVINQIEEKSKVGSFGNWQTWTYYILARYLHQMATK